MAVDLFANLAQTAVTSGGTTAPAQGTVEAWAVASPGAFPVASPVASPPTQFRITDPLLPSERIRVTDSRTSTWTVVRGDEGSTPAAHPAGFTVEAVITAGALGEFVQAGNIPQLAQYAPAGLTGATAPTSYAGGTVSGHPLSGLWTQGQWVVDQTGKIYVCVAGGTPGTWRRAGKDPWQFFLDDYAKGDGRQALVTVANGSATVSTTPLAAPAAPSLTPGASGGTMALGAYQVISTFVNRWGETVGSSSATVSTTTNAATLTIASPTPAGNATGWYSYVTAVNGAVYYRQQAAGSPTPLGQSLVLTAPPSTAGAQPPGSDASAAQVFTSTAVDGGKNIMICGADGSPGGPLIDTIATVISPTQATLSSQTPTVSQAGCPMVFSSDDRLAIDACIQAAVAYGLANQQLCEVVGSDRIYGLGTGLFQSTVAGGGLQYNTQVRIPAPMPSGQAEKFEFRLVGPGDASWSRFWVSQYVNLSGCTFLSYSVGPNSTPDPTYGQQSVIGGPGGGTGSNGSNGFANVLAVIRGVSVIQPGWSNSIGIDLQWIGGCVLRGRASVFAPGYSSAGVVNPLSAWNTQSFWQNNKIAIGVRLPNEGNNDQVQVESLTVEGLNTVIATQGDHVIIGRLCTTGIYNGIVFQGGGDSNAHNLTVRQWSFENTAGAAILVSSGTHIDVDITMDGEQTGIGYDVKDPSNALYGEIKWNDGFRTAGGPAGISAPAVTGAANVRVVNRQVARQVYGAPTYALGTPLQNPWFFDMQVSLAGGTVTNVQVGPTSAACTTSVATATPCTFKLPTGWWFSISGSAQPATFTAIPS